MMLLFVFGAVSQPAAAMAAMPPSGGAPAAIGDPPPAELCDEDSEVRLLPWEGYWWECVEVEGGGKFMWVRRPRLPVTDFREFIPASSGLCLDASGAGQANGTPIIQWNCNGGHQQWWAAEFSVNGYSLLVNYHSGRCVGVPSGSTVPGVGLTLWDCHTATLDHLDQWWRKEPAAGGTVLRNARSGQVLAIASGSAEPGARAIQFPYNGHPDQIWNFFRVV
jgi:hypothetical protein